MSTIIENKKPVSPNWQTTKVQAETVKSVASLYASLQTVLSQKNPELVAEVTKIILINKGYYVNLPIKAPIDLINAIAEYTANILGIKVAITGDNNKPAIVFEGGTLAEKLAAINSVPPNQVPALIESYKEGIADLGTQFGFKTEIVTVQPDFIVSFTK